MSKLHTYEQHLIEFFEGRFGRDFIRYQEAGVFTETARIIQADEPELPVIHIGNAGNVYHDITMPSAGYWVYWVYSIPNKSWVKVADGALMILLPRAILDAATYHVLDR